MTHGVLLKMTHAIDMRMVRSIRALRDSESGRRFELRGEFVSMIVERYIQYVIREHRTCSFDPGYDKTKNINMQLTLCYLLNSLSFWFLSSRVYDRLVNVLVTKKQAKSLLFIFFQPPTLNTKNSSRILVIERRLTSADRHDKLSLQSLCPFSVGFSTVSASHFLALQLRNPVTTCQQR